MNYETVFNIFLGMLTLLGCALGIVFWIVFPEEKTLHPIYRRLEAKPTPMATLPSQQSAATLQPKHDRSDWEPVTRANRLRMCTIVDNDSTIRLPWLGSSKGCCSLNEMRTGEPAGPESKTWSSI